MTMHGFTEVTLRSDGAIQTDMGDLTIREDSIQFDGHKESVRITNTQFVSVGKPSGLVFGDWVRVEYGEDIHPSVVFFKEKKSVGGVNRIYSALQDYPNSRQFECRVWVRPKRRFRITLGSAPRKHWGLTILKKGVIASTRAQMLTLVVRGLEKCEIAMSEITGFRQESLTVKRQLLSMGLDTLIGGAGIGLLVSVVYLIQQSNIGQASLIGFVNLFALFAGIGITLEFLWAIPTLLRMRAFELFTLEFKTGRQWEFGVSEQQVENVVETMRSYGIENQVK